jgi:hypothetical protein
MLLNRIIKDLLRIFREYLFIIVMINTHFYVIVNFFIIIIGFFYNHTIKLIEFIEPIQINDPNP